MEDLASLISAAMTERGMSRRDVEAAAERHGFKVSHSTVSKIARGTYASPGERILNGLALALDIPLVKLRDAAGVAEPGSAFRLPDYASRLSPSERAAVEHIVRVMVEAKDDRKAVGSHEDSSAPISQADVESAHQKDYGLAAHEGIEGEPLGETHMDSP